MPKKRTPKRKLGRPATGKRSNAKYRQTSLWLKRATLAETQRSLITTEGRLMDLSELVQVLLEAWLTADERTRKDLVKTD